MLNVDDHKSSAANVPFTACLPLISDPRPGLADPRQRPGGGTAAINKRDNVTAALRCHGGRGVFSQAERAAMIKAAN